MGMREKVEASAQKNAENESSSKNSEKKKRSVHEVHEHFSY